MGDITSNLIFYLKLDDGSGTTAVDDAGSADGTLVNGPSWETGSLGGALLFNNEEGPRQYVEAPFTSTAFPMTLSCRVRIPGSFSAAWAGVLFSRQAGSGIHLGPTEFGRELRYSWNDESNTWGWSSGLVLPEDGWAQIALVVESDKATMYMRTSSGMSFEENEVSHSLADFEEIVLAYDNIDTGRRLWAYMDEVRIYARALTEEDVEDLYDYTGAPSPIEGDADFTEPNETVAATGAVAVVGVGAFTEPTDTLTGTGSVAVVGAANFTEPNEALSSDVGVRWYADAAFTEPNETLAGEAAVAVVGALNATDPAAEALSSAVAVAVVGAADFTEPNETLSSDVDVEGAILADLAGIEPNETLEGAAAVAISAALAGTEANEALNGVAAVAVVGSAEFTEPNETVSSTGTGANVATAEFTEANETLEGAGAVAVVGSAAFTEAGETVASDAAVRVFADLIGTEANDNLSSTAAVAIVANAAFTEPNEQLGSLVDTGTGFVYGTHRRISIGVGIGV